LHLTAVESDALVGLPSNNPNATRVALDQVVHVERRKFSGLKTGLFVVGVLVVIGLVGYAIAITSIASGP